MIAGFQLTRKNQMNAEPLETKCENCAGSGFIYEREEVSGKSECEDCNGSGFVPTSIGARILDLIRHNSRVTVSAELRVSSSAR